MPPYHLSTCPQSHRRPRDAMRRNWPDLVSEWSSVWAVLIDDRPAIVAPTRERLVVTSAAAERADHTIGLDQVTDVSAVRSVVHIMDRGGNCYDFTFPDGSDAVRAAKLIDEMRASARERGAEEAAVGRDQQPEDLLARRSNGHPIVGSRVVRWADDTDLDDDGMDEMDLAEPEPEPDPARPAAEPASRVDLTRDIEVHPRAGPAAGTGTVPAEDDGGAPADPSGFGTGDLAPAELEHVGSTDAPAPVEGAEDPAPDDRPTPEAVGDDSDVEPERPIPSPQGAPTAQDDPEIDTYAPDDRGEGGGPQPIEQEVTRAMAAGLPLDPPPGAPARGPRSRPDSSAGPLVSIPAQGTPPSGESVLLVTTDAVPGRSVAVVHGDVLAVVSWPVAGRSGRSVHDAARARLAQAVLQRGGDAVIGLRYGSTGAVGGDVVAYGTAVTLTPLPPAAAPEEAGAVAADG